MKEELSYEQIDELLCAKTKGDYRKPTELEYKKFRELLQQLSNEHQKEVVEMLLKK